MLLFMSAHSFAETQSAFFKAHASCVKSGYSVASHGSKKPMDEATSDNLMDMCRDGLFYEVMESDQAVEEIKKSPEKVGCRIGAHYILKGNNKDATPAMIKELVTNHCQKLGNNT